MAATVLTAAQTDIKRGVVKTVIVIPTTVDGAAGATCDFQLRNAYAIAIQSVCANYNGKTIELKAACDGTNYLSLPTAKTFGADGIASVATADCSFFFYRLTITGAPLATATVTLVTTQVGPT